MASPADGTRIPDVSDALPIETGLSADAERLRLALEAGRLGTWEWDIAAGSVAWSAGLEAIHGLPRGTFEGTFEAYQKDIHPEDREHVLAAIKKTHEHGEDHLIEYRIIIPDGRTRWVEGRGKLFRDAAGTAIRMIGVCADVTQRKQAEEAARESEQRFTRFMQQFPGLAWIKDLDGRYVYANEAALRAFRTPKHRLYGRTDADVFPTETARQFQANDREASGSEAGIQSEETLEHEDGILHHSLVSKFPIHGPDGQISLIGSMAVDITDRKHAEAALRHALERQKVLLDELNHRVKNTLAVIQSIASQTLRDTPDPVSFKEAFSARLQALARAHTLLTKALWQGVSLEEVVSGAFSSLAPAQRSRVQSGAGPQVSIKPNAVVTLCLVLHELATNAARHGALAGEKGDVRVGWSMQAGESGSPRVVMDWQESGGPRVSPPKHRGFGSRLIGATTDQLGGEAQFDFAPDGLQCRLWFPLSELQASA